MAGQAAAILPPAISQGDESAWLILVFFSSPSPTVPLLHHPPSGPLLDCVPLPPLHCLLVLDRFYSHPQHHR